MKVGSVVFTRDCKLGRKGETKEVTQEEWDWVKENIPQKDVMKLQGVGQSFNLRWSEKGWEMQKNNARLDELMDDDNVVDFQEVTTKSSGSHGGFDHFTGMVIGTVFASTGNAAWNSGCDEYQLLAKVGPTVLLLNRQVNPKVHWVTAEERHIGAKFWKLNTLVQILHVPDASAAGSPPPKEERKDNNNGKRVPD